MATKNPTDNRASTGASAAPAGTTAPIITGDEEDLRGGDVSPVHSAEAARSRVRNPLDALADDVRAGNGLRDDTIDADLEASLEVLMQTWLSNALPDPPAKPGFHRVWASKSNSQTPPEFYERLGYRPVPPEEWTNAAALKMTSAAEPGVINVKEMLLYEIPEKRYQRFMRYLHHDAPLSEEQKIRMETYGHLTRGNDNLRRETGDGTDSLGRSPGRVPEFS